VNVSGGALLLSASAAAVTGVLGAALVLALARLRIALAAVTAPLVVVLSVAVGVLVGAASMLLTPADLAGLLLVVLASVPAALAAGVVIAARIQSTARAAERAAAAAETERRVEGQRRDLVAWISHDLRTPLAGIRATAEGIHDGVLSDTEAAVTAIQRNAQRMSDMVDDLLTLSRLQAPSVALDRSDVDIGDLVSDTVATLRPLAAAGGVELTGGAETGIRARVAAAELRRAVANLVSNGIRHSPAGATVETTVELREDSVVVAVADACGGIPPAELLHVFETGWRGTTARQPDAGAGLGLAIVRGVADAHRGTATVRNAARGCVFELSLPVAAASRTV
jgi:signal transduction histidine kinase